MMKKNYFTGIEIGIFLILFAGGSVWFLKSYKKIPKSPTKSYKQIQTERKISQFELDKMGQIINRFEEGIDVNDLLTLQRVNRMQHLIGGGPPVRAIEVNDNIKPLEEALELLRVLHGRFSKDDLAWQNEVKNMREASTTSAWYKQLLVYLSGIAVVITLLGGWGWVSRFRNKWKNVDSTEALKNVVNSIETFKKNKTMDSSFFEDLRGSMDTKQKDLIHKVKREMGYR